MNNIEILMSLLIVKFSLHHEAERVEQAENQLTHSHVGSLIIAPLRKKDASVCFAYKLNCLYFS